MWICPICNPENDIKKICANCGYDQNRDVQKHLSVVRLTQEELEDLSAPYRKKEQEALEAAKKAAEQAALLKKESERKEAERRKAEEEARRRKAEEEEARRRRVEEEKARRRRAEEEEARRKRAKEAEAERKRAEEAEAVKQKTIDEVDNKEKKGKKTTVAYSSEQTGARVYTVVLCIVWLLLCLCPFGEEPTVIQRIMEGDKGLVLFLAAPFISCYFVFKGQPIFLYSIGCIVLGFVAMTEFFLLVFYFDKDYGLHILSGNSGTSTFFTVILIFVMLGFGVYSGIKCAKASK